MSKFYIKTNENNEILKGFSDAFEYPIGGDICINENGGRHFELLGEINPSLIDEYGLPKYKFVDGEIVEILIEEKQSTIDAIISDRQQQASQTPERRLELLESALNDLFMEGV